MASRTCTACGRLIDDPKIIMCPQCGVFLPRPPRGKLRTTLIGGLAAIIFGGITWAISSGTFENADASTKAGAAVLGVIAILVLHSLNRPGDQQ